MKKAKKILALVLCAVLLIGASVAGTVAYLTSQDVVTNSFTVGEVEITLDEAKVDEYGTVVPDADRVEANTYKLVPNHSYTKDPIIHVAEGSEPCYLFVKVDNGIAAIEAAPTIHDQMIANGWQTLADQNGVYYKATAVDARTAAQDVAVFGRFAVAENADVSAYAAAKITVTAYAVQADGFASAEAAWAAAPASWT